MCWDQDDSQQNQDNQRRNYDNVEDVGQPSGAAQLSEAGEVGPYHATLMEPGGEGDFVNSQLFTTLMDPKDLTFK